MSILRIDFPSSKVEKLFWNARRDLKLAGLLPVARPVVELRRHDSLTQTLRSSHDSLSILLGQFGWELEHAVRVRQGGLVVMELDTRVLDEVVDLHVFFEGWLGGTLAKTRSSFAVLEQALGAQFEMVVPSGVELGRGGLVESLWAAHGLRPGLRIAIEGCRVLAAAPGRGALVVAGYEELQTGSGDSTRRVSTVTLRMLEGDRLEWLHVHETWAGATA